LPGLMSRFSLSLASLIASRAVAGALSGNVAVIKSMLGELSTASTQARGPSQVVLGISDRISPIHCSRLSQD